MAQHFPRHHHSPEPWLCRLDRAADGMNPFLTTLAIGLVILNLTCLALLAAHLSLPVRQHCLGGKRGSECSAAAVKASPSIRESVIPGSAVAAERVHVLGQDHDRVSSGSSRPPSRVPPSCGEPFRSVAGGIISAPNEPPSTRASPPRPTAPSRWRRTRCESKGNDGIDYLIGCLASYEADLSSW